MWLVAQHVTWAPGTSYVLAPCLGGSNEPPDEGSPTARHGGGGRGRPTLPYSHPSGSLWELGWPEIVFEQSIHSMVWLTGLYFVFLSSLRGKGKYFMLVRPQQFLFQVSFWLIELFISEQSYLEQPSVMLWILSNLRSRWKEFRT